MCPEAFELETKKPGAPDSGCVPKPKFFDFVFSRSLMVAYGSIMGISMGQKRTNLIWDAVILR